MLVLVFFLFFTKKKYFDCGFWVRLCRASSLLGNSRDSGQLLKTVRRRMVTSPIPLNNMVASNIFAKLSFC